MTAEGGTSEDFIDRKGLHRQGVIFSVILVGVGLWNLPSLWYPFGEDHALAHLIGKLILEGSVPYRDVLDYKPPGVFYLHALIVGLVGDGMHWVRIADLMSLWVTMTMMLLVASHLQSPGAGLWGALLFGLAYPLMGFWNTGLQEGFLLPFLWWSHLNAIRGWNKGGFSYLALCGAALGIVFWFKYPYALPAVVLGIAGVLQGWFDRKGGRPLFRSTIILSSGFIAVLGAVTLYMWSLGALEDMVRFTVIENVSERVNQFNSELITGALIKPWGWIKGTPMLVVIAALAVGGVVSLCRPKRRGGWISMTYMLCMLVLVYLQMRFYRYHWIPLLSFMCLGAGFALVALGRGLRQISLLTKTQMTRCLVGLLTALLVVSGLRTHGRAFQRWSLYLRERLSWEAYLVTFRDPKMSNLPFIFQDWQVSQVLRKMDFSEETLFIWGFRPMVYYFSGFRPATSFVHYSPLRKTWPQADLWRRRFQEELLAQPPGSILIVKMTGTGWVNTLGAFEALLPQMHALMQYQYWLRARVGRFLIYQRLNQADR